MYKTYWRSADGGHVLEWSYSSPPASYPNKITRAEYERTRKADSASDLRRVLQDGATVYCILRGVSRSGMYRKISLVTVRDGELIDLTFDAHHVLGWRVHDDSQRAIGVSGCGMDMGFHLVDSLSHAIGVKLKHAWL